MRLAFIADIHGNAHALECVLNKCRELNVSEIYCLGDVLGYFPEAQQCLELLYKNNIACQKGNHEEMWLNPNLQAIKNESIYQLQAFSELLDPKWREIIFQWPTERLLKYSESQLWLIHGSPQDHLFGYVYPDTSLNFCQEMPSNNVIMANTHRPFIRTEDGITYINTGSVGLPRDIGNLAAFATYDTISQSWQIVRVPIDIEQIIAHFGCKIHESVIKCLRR